jgi:hypothetical protein
VVRSPERPRDHERGAAAGKAGNAMDARGVDGLGEGMSRKMVVSRRASIDVPAPGGPSITLWSERLHSLLLYESLRGCC